MVSPAHCRPRVVHRPRTFISQLHGTRHPWCPPPVVAGEVLPPWPAWPAPLMALPLHRGTRLWNRSRVTSRGLRTGSDFARSLSPLSPSLWRAHTRVLLSTLGLVLARLSLSLSLSLPLSISLSLSLPLPLHIPFFPCLWCMTMDGSCFLFCPGPGCLLVLAVRHKRYLELLCLGRHGRDRHRGDA